VKERQDEENLFSESKLENDEDEEIVQINKDYF
jgi:hypothetical protein